MVVPSGAELKLYWGINANGAVNVVGLIITGNPVFNQALADTVGSAVKSAFTSNLAPHISTGSGLVRVGVRDLRGDHLPEFRDTGATAAGTGTGDALPSHVALCITLRTAGSGKSFRGRVYLGGYTETVNQAGGTCSQAAATGSIGFLTAIDTALTSSGLRLAVLTRPQLDTVITRTVTQANGTTETTILSHQTAKQGAARQVTLVESRNLNWETQRRRNNGRGSLPTIFNAEMSHALAP